MQADGVADLLQCFLLPDLPLPPQLAMAWLGEVLLHCECVLQPVMNMAPKCMCVCNLGSGSAQQVGTYSWSVLQPLVALGFVLLAAADFMPS